MRVREENVPVRISAILLLGMGETRSEVSRYLGVSRVTVIKWARWFEDGGWNRLLRHDAGHEKTRRTRARPTLKTVGRTER